MEPAKIRRVIVGGNGPQLSYAALVAAGVPVTKFIEPRMDAVFAFDLPAPAAYRSRNSPFEMNIEGKGLVLQSNSAGKYLQMLPGSSGLIGPTTDAQEFTYTGLYNYRVPTPTDARILLAGSSADGNSSVGGEELYILNSGAIAMQPRGMGSAAASAAELQALGLPLDNVSRFVFIASTAQRTGTGDETTRTLYIGAPTPFVRTITGTKIIGARNLAFGNAYRSDAAYTQTATSVGLGMSGPGHRTLAQLAEMYALAKLMGQRRGMFIL